LQELARREKEGSRTVGDDGDKVVREATKTGFNDRQVQKPKRREKLESAEPEEDAVFQLSIMRAVE
jgi:uncharacterized protein (UPF0335 family)